MKHFYRNIHGYFDFPKVYERYAKTIPENGVFVELGTFCGQSIAYFTVEAINNEKIPEIYCVDTWQGMEYGGGESDNLNDYVRGIQDFYEFFLGEIAPIKKYINPIIGNTREQRCINYFDDGEIDILFVDADHTQTGLRQDLYNWYPKVKSGGIMAGHDYHNGNGVFLAVNRFCEAKKIEDIKVFPNNVWEVIK